MEIVVRFTEENLKEICGDATIEKYRRAMDRLQLNGHGTAFSETKVDREHKQREQICEKLLAHLETSGVFAKETVRDFSIEKDCYINPFRTHVTEFVEFVATMEV